MRGARSTSPCHRHPDLRGEPPPRSDPQASQATQAAGRLHQETHGRLQQPGHGRRLWRPKHLRLQQRPAPMAPSRGYGQRSPAAPPHPHRVAQQQTHPTNRLNHACRPDQTIPRPQAQHQHLATPSPCIVPSPWLHVRALFGIGQVPRRRPANPAKAGRNQRPKARSGYSAFRLSIASQAASSWRSWASSRASQTDPPRIDPASATT